MTIACATSALLAAFLLLSAMDGRSEFGSNLLRMLDIDRDQSFAEGYLNSLTFLSAGSLLLAFFVNAARPLLLFAVIYGFVWMDNSAQYHERVGKNLAEHFSMRDIFGLPGHDVGQVVAWAAVAAFLLPMVIWASRRRRPGDLGVLVAGGVLFAALVFFGVVIDAIHSAAPEAFHFPLMFLEEGGEFVVISLAAGLALGLARVGEQYYAIAPNVVPRGDETVPQPSGGGTRHGHSRGLGARPVAKPR